MGNSLVSSVGCCTCNCDNSEDRGGEECFPREPGKAGLLPFVSTTGDEHQELAAEMHIPWVDDKRHPVVSHTETDSPTWASSPEATPEDALAVASAAKVDGKVVSERLATAGSAMAADVAEGTSLDPAMVKRLIQGQHVELLSEGGGAVRCVAFLDRRLTGVTLKRIWQNQAAGKRIFRIEDIVRVMVGEIGGQDFGLRTHDLSVTLALKSQQAVAFTFSDPRERDDFARCLASLVDAATAASKRDSVTAVASGM